VTPAAPAAIARRRAKPNTRFVVVTVAALVVIAAMALDTKVVKIGSPANIEPGVFSAAAFGASEFPKVQAGIESRAVEAATLAAAIAKDKDEAGKHYGVPLNNGAEMSVKFTGVAGKADMGVYPIVVDGVPNTTIQVQTGPAIYGTDLRDATGTIAFGQFVNQIDYQNAGSALNKEMKKQVLSKVDVANLAGKTLSIVGAFKLVKPDNWLVTPVNLEVK
jgi:predicted lipoprotein